MAKRSVEIEIKLAVQNAGAVRRALRKLGFAPAGRERERDTLLDTSDLALRHAHSLLRLRRTSRHWILTYKGPPASDPRYKSRPEFETQVADGTRLLQIFEQLGYRPAFVYEKMRTDYRPARGTGVASLDVTPIGTYLELEGPRAWIDRTARALGFAPGQYITKSYGTLYFEYCREHGIEPTNMVFPASQQPSQKGHAT